MEDQIPLEYRFPQMLWKNEFHVIWGKCTFHQFIHNTVEIIFHKFYGKQDSTSVDELMEKHFSMNSVKKRIPQNLWKASFQWNLVFHK